MNIQEVYEYITLFEKNAVHSMKNGETQILVLWAEGCSHCHSQFKYWMRPLSHKSDAEGMGIDFIEYNKLLELRDLFGDETIAWQVYQRSDTGEIANKIAKASGKEMTAEMIVSRAEKSALKMLKGENPLSKASLNNIVTIANRILPVETSSLMGKKIILEAQAFANKVRTFDSPILKKPQDYEIRFTPTWIDYYTHENYGYGHHTERQLRDILNLNSLSSRRERFKAIHTQVMNQECDGVACGINERVTKIDPKQTR